MARKSPAPAKGNGRSSAAALDDLISRAARNSEGATQFRSDPLADVKAARAVAAAVSEHSGELSRRGLPPAYGEAALLLAQQIEEHLQALPAAAVTARGRSPEAAELLADAAGTAQRLREAVQRLSRGPDGRRTQRDFGLGEPFSARQPAHVARALERILAALQSHPELRADLGVQGEDEQTLRDLLGDLAKVPGAGTPISDEQARLYQAQAALRAFFDLFAAKTSLAMAGDPDERARLLALLPRAEDRRHLRREA
jgi:hypothetical protein